MVFGGTENSNHGREMTVLILSRRPDTLPEDAHDALNF